MTDLIEAANILSEYKEPNSLVDLGNLYFAATEYQTAYTALEAKLEKATFIIEKIMGGPLTKEQYDFFKNLQSIWESKCLAELEKE